MYCTVLQITEQHLIHGTAVEIGRWVICEKQHDRRQNLQDAASVVFHDGARYGQKSWQLLHMILKSHVAHQLIIEFTV